jgi:tetratricopeptide (TPR) repeat protein
MLPAYFLIISKLSEVLFSAIRQISGDHQSWSWESVELEKEIYHLRVAYNYITKVSQTEDHSDLRFRILTNLANTLNHTGRSAEAIALWDKVLAKHPNYGMSALNRGYAIYWYGRYLYDPGHQTLFLNESYHQVKQSLSFDIENHAIEGISEWLKYLLEIGSWENFNFHQEPESRGRSKREKTYRTWCINNRLFLNPLNDLWNTDIVANDVLTFPSVIIKLEENPSSSPPEVYGIYNQLKQEYVSARYMLFNAIEESQEAIHFSDKRVLLYNMLDYREYRLWIEKAKMAFLGAHAIFDKIAYLVNKYWSLELPARKINFTSCWFNNGNPAKGLAKPFASSENWALRGLYWLSKDFKETNESQVQPEAWHIAQIRNHIAHKYLKVFDHMLVDTEGWRKRTGHEWEYPISDQELINQTLQLLSLVRNALIYVSLAAHHDEQKKRTMHGDEMLGVMLLHKIKDSQRF